MALSNPLEFIRQVRQEVDKISWPSRQETFVTSIMVIIFSFIAALFFLGADGLISLIIGSILG